MKRIAAVGLLSVGFAASQMAGADTAGAGAYLGAGLGQSYVRSVEHAAYATWNEDDTNTVWKIFGGYRFNPYLGVEAAYTDLGKGGFSYANPGLNGSGRLSSHTFSVAATGRLPLANSLALLGKLGVASVTNKTSDAWNTGSFSGRRSTTVPLLGIGAEYAVTRNVGVRAEYEAYGKSEYASAASANPRLRTDAFTIGVGYHF